VTIACACLSSFPISAHAADADNSGSNVVDRNDDAKTPQSQSNDKADVDVTRAIRRAVVKDSSLSVYAHNVKIITTKEHTVYLRGAVPSQGEASKINDLAQQNSNGYAVKCQLSIKNK
jgi:hyperosmotically inducible protein